MKKSILMLITLLGMTTSMFAQLGATVTNPRFYESDVEHIREMVVTITPTGETQSTACLFFQDGEMEDVYVGMLGLTPLDMFYMYEDAIQQANGHSTFQEGVYDTIYHSCWDTVDYVVWVCCANQTDTAIVSQLIPWNYNGLEQIDIAQVSLYPNPASEVLNISCSERMQSLEIFNQLGQRVLSQDINANSHNVNVQPLSQGTYFIRIKTSTQTIIKKFIY